MYHVQLFKVTAIPKAKSICSVQYMSLELVLSSFSRCLHYNVRLITKSSKPVSFDHNSAGHYVIYSPVVLKEKKCDECWKEECDGEVLV